MTPPDESILKELNNELLQTDKEECKTEPKRNTKEYIIERIIGVTLN